MTKTTEIALQPDTTLYLASDGELQLDVRVDSETVWLTQAQMAELFGSSQRMMSYHINNVFAEGELPRGNNIQKMYIDGAKKPTTLHNLDVIISVGYRVKSARGVHFRRWATRILRERLLQDHRHRQAALGRLQTLGSLATHVSSELEARSLLSIIERYSNSWQLLRQFDEDQFPSPPRLTTKRMKRLTLKQSHAAISALKSELMSRGEASDLFGREPSGGLAGILGNIEQTFDGKPLYPSVEERAATLLYSTIKNHPFTDGNKRIGSLLFVHYLDKNNRLLREDGSPRFNDNALVATALLVAESDPKQREMVLKLILAMLS
jgi:prophage maintenance system killer protein